MDYLLHLLVFVLIYGIVALKLNVASGFTQIISLAQAGFSEWRLYVGDLGYEVRMAVGCSTFQIESFNGGGSPFL